MEQDDTLQSFYELDNIYNTEEKCRDLFLSYIWNDGVICDKCGVVNDKKTLIKLSDKKEKGLFKCSVCGSEFEAATNCLFSDSDLSFKQWLFAIYFVVFADNTMSSIALKSIVGKHQRKAWETQLKIFNLLYQDMVLDGFVEMDETYVGGKEKNKHKQKQSIYTDKVVGEKIPMFGIYERTPKDESGKNKLNGRIVLQRIHTPENKKVCGADIKGFIQQFISDSDDVLFFTDRAKIYNKKLLTDRRHETVKHSKANKKKTKKEDKKKDVTNNTQSTPAETEFAKTMKQAYEDAIAINKANEKKKEPYYIRYSWVTKDGILVTTNGIENVFGHFKRDLAGTNTSVTRKYIQFYADRFCFRWNTRHLPLKKRMELFFQRMAKREYKSVDDLKPAEETGRKSKKWRNEQRRIRKEQRKLEKWLKELPNFDLDLRNVLLEIYYFELSVSQGMSFMAMETAKNYDSPEVERARQQNPNGKIPMYADCLRMKDQCFDLLKRFKKQNPKKTNYYNKVIAEYESLKAIPNKKERMAAIKKRVKMGGEKIE